MIKKIIYFLIGFAVAIWLTACVTDSSISSCDNSSVNSTASVVTLDSGLLNSVEYCGTVDSVKIYRGIIKSGCLEIGKPNYPAIYVVFTNKGGITIQ